MAPYMRKTVQRLGLNFNPLCTTTTTTTQFHGAEDQCPGIPGTLSDPQKDKTNDAADKRTSQEG